MLLEDERGTVNLIVPPPVYERRRATVRTAPLLRARGRLERREGVVNLLVADLDPIEWNGPAEKAEVKSLDPRSTQQSNRAQAVAELRAVAPAGHSWGRRAG